jgi:hypothetical protein
MAAKKKTGSRNLARNPTIADQRLGDIGFYWSMLTDSQRNDVYNAVAKLHTFNESYEEIESGESPRVVLVESKRRSRKAKP